MASLHQHIAEALGRIDARDERRRLRPVRLVDHGRLERGGRLLVDFSSNDYLGLAGHPLPMQRSAEWMGRLGNGSGASRLVTGTSDAHLALEARIAAFKGKEAALLFASGWQANASAIAALLKAAPGTLLFTDRLIHASMHAGAAGHRQIRFRHNDIAHLAALLKEHAEAPGPRLIVVESVYSMDGDRADLPALSALARAHDAFLYVDEAHATGVLGPEGRGLAAGLDIDLVMGTFSKAMGSFGAYVAGSRPLVDYLVNACGGFIFSTAPSPAMLGAIDAALDLVPGMDAERAHLSALGGRFRQRLSAAGIGTGESATQIVPVIVGAAADALALQERLEAEGMLAAAIRPPTVPRGESRLRVALRSTHSADDVDALADAIVGHFPR